MRANSPSGCFAIFNAVLISIVFWIIVVLGVGLALYLIWGI
jgi:hypothetical protein